MAENLWAIRRHKKMKVRDLAVKSGVPAAQIHRYEAGEQPISQAHLRQLARALIVETWEIKILSDAKPKSQRSQAEPRALGEDRPVRKQRPARPPAPVRPSQLEHLLRLAERFPDVDQVRLEEQAGKGLEELTKLEASKLLSQLQERMRVEQPPRTKQPFDRQRAYLPEGVDEFELKYLTEAREAADTLYVSLFDDTQIDGQLIGFGPYTITLRQADGKDVTINKLAIAYYRKKGADT